MEPESETPRIHLSTDDGRDWIASLTGDGTGDRAGRNVAGIGDIDGDGFDDIAVSDPGPGNQGRVHVVFGSAEGLSGALDLSATSAAGGLRITGLTGDGATGQLGLPPAGIGDFNGDGIDDFIIGESQRDRAHVIFGSDTGLPSEIDIASLDGTNGVTLGGADDTGGAVSGAGDVNGDGIADIVIGAWRAGEDPLALSGKSYLVFGRDTAIPAEIDLEALDGADGFAVLGEDYAQWSGDAVSDAGDFNGDGYDDFLIGSRDQATSRGSAGQAYLIFGGPEGFPAELDLAALNGVNGVKILGEERSDGFGSSLDSAGDINGDGIDDIVVGAIGGEAAYVIFGTRAAQFPTFEVEELDGTNGFVIEHSDRSSAFGASVSGVGDIDGDGIDDLVVGAYDGTYSYGDAEPGSAFVIFGSRDGFAARLDAQALGAGGVEIVGEAANDRFGISVSGAGDFDGDGQTDLLVGAMQDVSYNAPVPDGPGKAYLLRDVRFTLANTSPEAVDDEVEIGEDDTGVIRFSVLANDSDAEDSYLELVSYEFDDPRGTLTHLGRGVFEFSPDGDFEGLEDGETETLDLRYTIQDSVGARSEAVASILVRGADDMHDFTMRLELGFNNYDPDAEGVPEGWDTVRVFARALIEDPDDTGISSYDFAVDDPDGQVAMGGGGYVYLRRGVFLDNDVKPVVDFDLTVTAPGGASVTRSFSFDVVDRFDTVRPPASSGPIVAGPESEIFALDAGQNVVVRDVSMSDGPDYLRDFGLGDSLLFTGIDYDALGSRSPYRSLRPLDDAPRFSVDGAETVLFDPDYGEGILKRFIAGPDSYAMVVMPRVGAFSEGVAVAEDASFGVAPEALLTGAFFDGMLVTLQESQARMDNYLGYYVLDGDGTLSDFGTVFQNVNDSWTGRTRGISTVGDDQKLGFFLVADGADRLGDGPDALEIVGDRLVLREDGAVIDDLGVYSTDFASADGLEHVVMGYDGERILIGFEDTDGGGDRDFQDVLIEIESFLI